MRDDTRAAWRTFWIGCLIVPLALLVGSVGLQALLALSVGDDDAAQDAFLASIEGFTASVYLSQLALALVLWFVLTGEREPWASRLGLARGVPGSWNGGDLVRMACATIGVTVLTGLVLAPWLDEPTAYGERLHAGIAQARGAWLPILLFGMTVLPALFEELVFRGYLLRGLQRGWRTGWAWAVSSIAFAFAHMDPLYALRLVPLALWLGWLTVRTDSVVPAIVCHFANNLVFVLLARFAGDWVPREGVSEGEPLPPAVAIASVAVLLFVGYALWSLYRVIGRLRAVRRPPQGDAGTAQEPPVRDDPDDDEATFV